jgi:hypothetical protein
MAFDRLGAERVEIRCDTRNARSQRVAERAEFQLEGILRRDSKGADGAVRDTRLFAHPSGLKLRKMATQSASAFSNRFCQGKAECPGGCPQSSGAAPKPVDSTGCPFDSSMTGNSGAARTLLG